MEGIPLESASKRDRWSVRPTKVGWTLRTNRLCRIWLINSNNQEEISWDPYQGNLITVDIRLRLKLLELKDLHLTQLRHFSLMTLSQRSDRQLAQLVKWQLEQSWLEMKTNVETQSWPTTQMKMMMSQPQIRAQLSVAHSNLNSQKVDWLCKLHKIRNIDSILPTIRMMSTYDEKGCKKIILTKIQSSFKLFKQYLLH